MSQHACGEKSQFLSYVLKPLVQLSEALPETLAVEVKNELLNKICAGVINEVQNIVTRMLSEQKLET
jgi:hypothetical protein